MQHIVINAIRGGFGLSRAAFHRLRELGSEPALAEPDIGEKWKDGSVRGEWPDAFCDSIQRTDPLLVQVVRELGKAANGTLADLKIVEVPDGVKWTIEEYDGLEQVAECHRTWS